MDFKRLPVLCIDLIIVDLREENIIRRFCDVIRDCIALSATSHDVNTYFALPFAYELSPLNDYEKISSDYTKNDIQKVCRKHNLRMNGKKRVLVSRLQAILDDPRNRHTNLGRKITRSAMQVWARRFHRYEAVEILEKLGLSPREISSSKPWRESFHSFVHKILIPFHGDSRVLLAARSSLISERQFESELRKLELSQALYDRGCRLRPDSEISSAFLRDSPDAKCLSETVDIAEEMQFYYTMTEYSTILRKNRMRSIDYDYDYSDDENYDDFRDNRRAREEENRRSSKKEAVLRWFKLFLSFECNSMEDAQQRVPNRIFLEFLSTFDAVPGQFR